MQKIALGTAAMGRPQYINIKRVANTVFDKELFTKNALDLLEMAYKKGIRYFDTSPGYGMAEDVLIDWVQTKKDNSIELATKWGYSYMANFDPKATIHEIKDHKLSKLKQQWEVSKKLLPFLTTYQIHSATFDTGVLEDEQVLHKLDYLRQEYKLNIGISTTGSNQVEVLKRALDIEVDGKQIFNTFQVTYNILDQSLAEVSDVLQDQGKRVIIKEALANGRLFKNASYSNYTALYTALEHMAHKYTVGIDAIVLDFCAKTIHPFTVLSGASDTVQLQENLKANSIDLEESDIALLKSFKVAPAHYWSERKKLAWN